MFRLNKVLLFLFIFFYRRMTINLEDLIEAYSQKELLVPQTVQEN